MPTIREAAWVWAENGGSRRTFDEWLADASGGALNSKLSSPDAPIGPPQEPPPQQQPVDPVPEVTPVPGSPEWQAALQDVHASGLEERQSRMFTEAQQAVEGGAAYRASLAGIGATQRRAQARAAAEGAAESARAHGLPDPYIKPTIRAIGEVGEYATRAALAGSFGLEAPSADPGLAAAREADEARRLEEAVTPQQKGAASIGAGLLATPEYVKGRAHTVYVRSASLLGTLGAAATHNLLMDAKARDPHAWESDEEATFDVMKGFFGVTLTKAERVDLDKQFERDAKDNLARQEEISRDAIEKYGDHSLLALALDNAPDTLTAIIEFVNEVTGGDIPDEYWETESTDAERQKIIGDALKLNPDIDPEQAEMAADAAEFGRKHDVLQDDAQEFWLNAGADMKALLSALMKNPKEVGATQSIALTTMLVPLVGPMSRLARVGAVRPLNYATMRVANGFHKLLNKMPTDNPLASGMIRATARVREASATLERTLAHRSKMADPITQGLATEGIEQARETQARVASAGDVAAEIHARAGRDAARPPVERSFEEGTGFSLREAGAEAAVEPQGFQLGHVDPATGRFIPSREPARTPGDVAFERAELRARKQEAARVELEQPRAPTLDPETGTFIPTRQPLGLPSPETVTPSPLPGSLTHKQLAGLTRFVEKNPALEGQVVAMLTEGVSAADIVARLKRAYDPAHTRPVALETVREPLGAADMPAFEDVALPEGFTRADVGLPPREFAAPGVEGGRRATAAPEVLPEVAEARAAMEAKRARAATEAEGAEWQDLAALHDSAVRRLFARDAEFLAGQELLTRTPAERGLDPFTEPAPSTTPWKHAGEAWVHDVAKEVLGPGWKDVARELGSTEALWEHITPLREAAIEALFDAEGAWQRPIMAELKALEARGALSRLPSELRSESKVSKGWLRREPIPRERSLVVREAQEAAPIDVIAGEAPLRPEHNPRAYAERPPDPANMGYRFTRERYDMGENGVLRRLPESEDIVVELEPGPRRISPEVERVLDDLVDVLGEEGVFTPGAVAKAQLAAAVEAAMDSRLANNLGIGKVREAVFEATIRELVERTGRPDLSLTLRKQIAVLLDKAKEGQIKDLSINYPKPDGGTGTLNIVPEVMRPVIESSPEFRTFVESEGIRANLKREASRARQKATRDTYGRAILDWSPEYRGKGTVEDAAKNPPTVTAEVDYFIKRYNETGELPPIARNRRGDLIAEGRSRIPPDAEFRAREAAFPSMLERRLGQMVDASDGVLDSARIADVLEAGARDVRLPSLNLQSLSPGGEAAPKPYLSVWGPLEHVQKWVSYDKGWMNETPVMLAGENLHNAARRLASLNKAFKVPANTSSWVGAIIGNTITATMKLGDPFASVKAIGAILDFYRFRAGMPTRYPAGWYEALMPFLDTGFTKQEIFSRGPGSRGEGTVTWAPKKGEGFWTWMDRVRYSRPIKQAGAGGRALGKWSGYDLALKTFDHLDNGPKLYEGLFNMGRHLKEWEMLTDGHSKTLHLGDFKEVTAFYRESSIPGKSHMEVNGKRLTETQKLAIVGRASMEPALKTYVNFDQLPMGRLYLRHIPEADLAIFSPFQGWKFGTTTNLWRGGILGEVLAGPTPRGKTTSPVVAASRAMSQAIHSMKLSLMYSAGKSMVDPDSAMLRRLAAFHIRDPGLQVGKPTSAPGVYNVWNIDNANTFESLESWLRLAETGVYTLEDIHNYIDPSYAKKSKKYRMMPEDEIEQLDPADQKLVRAKQALWRDRREGGGMSTASTAAWFYVGGSALASELLRLASTSDIKDISAPSVLDVVSRNLARMAIPGGHRRLLQGTAEQWAIDLRSDAREVAALMPDDGPGREAGQAEIDSLYERADVWDYFAGVDRGEFVTRVTDPYPLEEAGKKLSKTLMQHLFKSPRAKLLWDPRTRSAKSISKMKKAFLEGMDSRISKKIGDMTKDAAEEFSSAEEALAAGDTKGYDRHIKIQQNLSETIKALERRAKTIMKRVGNEYKQMLKEMEADVTAQEKLRKKARQKTFKRSDLEKTEAADSWDQARLRDRPPRARSRADQRHELDRDEALLYAEEPSPGESP
mgnify:CR=1 FL=1